ncbi:hypothetical protein BT93_G1741 [Corymbia citriodora subsp. variegata]|nr:hypothetical protein BT93_G1741 [Corymbia citriodora subsp. variegata]
MDKCSRDLLQKFMCSSSSAHRPEYRTPNEETEELELNLGLSLGGKFGVDKSSSKLFRSSSIAGAMTLLGDEDNLTTSPSVPYPSLMRTSSLPTETEEEWRKRKEMQTLRRMEAKRRRLERQRSLKTEREAGCDEEKPEIEGKLGLNSRDKHQVLVANAVCHVREIKSYINDGILQRHENAMRGCNSKVPPFGLAGWAEAAKQALIGAGVEVGVKGKCGASGGCGSGGSVVAVPGVEAQGKISLERSESDIKCALIQGSSSCRDDNGSIVNQHLKEPNNKLVRTLSSKVGDNLNNTLIRAETQSPSEKSNSVDNVGKEFVANATVDMPWVFTRGDGPDGKRIEGILYKYGKGEEVRIVCVCHGNFLSPAEFVKHAGGGDVANPRRHIFISTNPVFSQ